MDDLNNVNESAEEVIASEISADTASEIGADTVSGSVYDYSAGVDSDDSTDSGSGLNVFGLIAMIVGILGILGNICCCCVPIPFIGGVINVLLKILFLIMGIAALVLGIIGKKQADKSTALALVGLILGIVVIVLSGGALLISVFSGIGKLIIGLVPQLEGLVNQITSGTGVTY